jgi:hypothetical protein
MKRVLLVLLLCSTWIAGWAVAEVEPPDCQRHGFARSQQQVQVARKRLELHRAECNFPSLSPMAVPFPPELERYTLTAPRAPPI